MPMGIVSDEDFAAQLNNVTNPRQDKFVPPVPFGNNESNDSSEKVIEPELISESTGTNTGEILPFKKRGRQIGDVEVPETLRKMIAETAHIEGRAAALMLGKDFGVSPAAISAYTKGATSTATYHKPEQDIIQYVRARKNRVTKKALRVMQNSLDELTPERLRGAKAKDIAGIARDMSTIIGNMSDKNTENTNVNGPTFVLYSPQIQEENSFKAIPSSE
jgi:hypothetical protein